MPYEPYSDGANPLKPNTSPDTANERVVNNNVDEILACFMQKLVGLNSQENSNLNLLREALSLVSSDILIQAPDEAWIEFFKEESVLNELMHALSLKSTREGLIFAVAVVKKAEALNVQTIWEAAEDGKFNPLMYAMLGLKQNGDKREDKDSYKDWAYLAAKIVKNAPKALTQVVTTNGDYQNKAPLDIFVAMVGESRHRNEYFHILEQIICEKCPPLSDVQQLFLDVLLSNLKKNPDETSLVDITANVVKNAPSEVWQQLVKAGAFDKTFGGQFILIMVKKCNQLKSHDEKNLLMNGLIKIALQIGQYTNDYAGFIDLHALCNAQLLYEDRLELFKSKSFLVFLLSNLKKDPDKKILIDFFEQVIRYVPSDVWSEVIEDGKFNEGFDRKFISIVLKRCDQLTDRDEKKLLIDSLIPLVLQISRHTNDYADFIDLQALCNARLSCQDLKGLVNNKFFLDDLLESLEKNSGRKMLKHLIEEGVKNSVFNKQNDESGYHENQLINELVKKTRKISEDTGNYSSFICLMQGILDIYSSVDDLKQLFRCKSLLAFLLEGLEKNSGNKFLIDITEQALQWVQNEAWEQLLKDEKFSGAFGRKFIAVMVKKRDQLENENDKDKLTERLLEVYIANRATYKLDTVNPLIFIFKNLFSSLLKLFWNANKKSYNEGETFYPWSGLFGGYTKDDKIGAAEQVLQTLNSEIKDSPCTAVKPAAKQGLLGSVCVGLSRRVG